MIRRLYWRSSIAVRDTYRRGLLMNIASAMGGSQFESFSYGYDALNRPLVRNSDAFGYNERGELFSPATTYAKDTVVKETQRAQRIFIRTTTLVI